MRITIFIFSGRFVRTGRFIYIGECKLSCSVKILGVSKVSVFNRVTLVSDVVKQLKIKTGDKVVFELDEKTGVICIKKG